MTANASAEPHDAAHARDAVDAAHARLAAGGDLDLALLVAHGGRPVRRAVHEQAVAQGHPAEAELAFGDRNQEKPPRELVEEGRGEAEVAHVDALVVGVDQRPGLVERLVALGEEAVGDAVGERGAEPAARVGERGQDTGTASAPASCSATQSRIASISGESIGERLPTTCLGELDLE